MMIKKLINIASSWLALVSSACVGFLMLATVVDVTWRTVFKRAVPGVYEYSELLLAFVVFLGIAYAQQQKAHIDIGEIGEKIFSERLLIYFQVVSQIIVCAFFVLMTYKSMDAALLSYERGEIRHGLLFIPYWPARFAVFIGLLFLLLENALDLLKLVQTACEGIRENIWCRLKSNR